MAAAAAELLALREALRNRFPNAEPVVYRTAGAVATGLGPLDGMLPGGGLPRGRLVVWAPGGAATAMMRSASHAVIARGERAAWIDGQHGVTGDWWVRGPMLLRPSGETNALVCAEELLRSGGFALVVLTGVMRGLEREGVRISRAVKEGGGAFVALAPHLPVAHMRVASSIRPDGYSWKLDPFGEPTHIESVRVRVDANAMGWSGRADVVLPVHCHPQRMAADPLLRDRRGARRRPSSKEIPRK